MIANGVGCRVFPVGYSMLSQLLASSLRSKLIATMWRPIVRQVGLSVAQRTGGSVI